MKTSVLLDHEPVADGGYFVRALLRIEGDAPTPEGRIPLNLSLVLDRSGSMSGEPLRAAREAASMLVRRLSVEDVVSVVAYDDEVEVVAAPATGAEQEDLVHRIGQIDSRGMTNLSGGWLRARDLVATNVREGGVSRIVLLTDGLANRGITNPEQLIGLTRTAAGTGIATTTIGFGPSFDEDLLRAMADAGQGGAYYIERPDQASGVFEEELEGLLSLAAQNVRVAVRPGAEAEFIQVAHTYPSHAEGDALTVEVGDLYAREPRRLLLEFLVGEAPAEGHPVDVGRLDLTAHVLTPEGGVELHTIEIPITVSLVAGGRTDPVVRKEILLLEAARVREQALEARERGDYRSGAALLSASMAHLRSEADGDEVLGEELADLEQMHDMFVREEVAESDVKYMKQRSYDSSRSRDSAKDRYRRG